VGTAAYMSPEQVKAKELDGRSDLFSFGIVLYQGRPDSTGSPPIGTSLLSALRRHAVDRPSDVPLPIRRVGRGPTQPQDLHCHADVETATALHPRCVSGQPD
jgi:serine/threonine protein kinase